MLTWQANPQNSEIVKYNLYEQNGGGQKLLVALDADIFEHVIRNVNKEKQYVYALTAINVHGRESSPAVISVK